MTAKILKECNNGAVMLTVHNAQQARFYYDNDSDHLMSAFVLTKEAFYTYEKAGVPWGNLIAYIGPTNSAQNNELLNMLHEKGVMCMISAAPSYDNIKDAALRAVHYRETFTMGADILETDLPIEAAAAINSIMPEAGFQMKCWGKIKLINNN